MIPAVLKTQFVFNILGYAIYLSIFTCFVIVLIRFLPLTKYKGSLLPKVNERMYYLGFFSITSVSASFMALCNVGLQDPKDWPYGGPKYAWKVTLVVWLATLFTFWVLLPTLLLNSGVKVKFYLLDFLLMPNGLVVT